MKKQCLFIVLLVSLVGCRTPVKVERSFTTVPEVGVLTTVGIGEPLLVKTDGVSSAALLIESDQDIGEFRVLKGKYNQISKNSEYATFGYAANHSDVGAKKFDKLFIFDKDVTTKVVCVSRKVCSEIVYSLEKTTKFIGMSSFQQTLLYSGKIGNRITMGYREFSNDLARPAFSNDVVYDLSESTQLGYKGARIEVVKATNVDITYKVLSGFN